MTEFAQSWFSTFVIYRVKKEYPGRPPNENIINLYFIFIPTVPPTLSRTILGEKKILLDPNMVLLSTSSEKDFFSEIFIQNLFLLDIVFSTNFNISIRFCGGVVAFIIITIDFKRPRFFSRNIKSCKKKST